MIIEVLVNYFVNVLMGLIDMFNIVSIPADLISTLSAITGYGSYVVGSDLLLIVCACVGGWLSFKITAGIVLFIYSKIPIIGK